MNYLDILHAQLRVDEGERLRLYPDTKGKFTIGIGRNLSDVGINRGEMALMFDNDLAAAEAAARKLVPDFDALSDVRRAVIVNMAFQLGFDGLAQFQNTLRNIKDARWEDAATAMLASKVAQDQAPARWARHAKAMRTNTWNMP